MKTITAENCPKLEYIQAWTCCKLTAIYANGCPSLKTIDTDNCNALKTLQISGCTALEELSLFDNVLTSLDLSNCCRLRWLVLSQNTVTFSRIDIRRCPKLVYVYNTATRNEFGNTCYYRTGPSMSSDCCIEFPKSATILADADLAILAHPEKALAKADNNATFTVLATGNKVKYQWQEYANGNWKNCSLTGYNTPTLTVKASSTNNAYRYRCLVSDSTGSMYSDYALLMLSVPFGTPDFKLPTTLTTIAASSFEGIDARVVQVPTTCRSIGSYAFRNSSVQRILIPGNCSIDTGVFDGCPGVLVYGVKGSPAEQYCKNYLNCIFVSTN